MKTKSSNQLKANKLKKKYRFFLNPYPDCAFTKCPKCETKTKVRKFALVIHIEPQQIFLLNKQCKYCPYCELIIAKKQEIEALMTIGFSQDNPQIVGNNYLVMGTIERQDWKQGNQGALSSNDILDRMYIFKDQWDFEVIPAGWYPNDELPEKKNK
ncbi:hypothetical protein [Gloeothece verrucosa]|uniref:Uncharacterized protein n=1 Tax=Gloeothece verrucosa (strain PCC 7822) TaxID=497965 RepID=E0UD82_GLOV7|nr:hypothetical protein [Gloeothece verrucosa]ADN12962.1 conserved hypothetical protein [Gloeothece verrucosa PCC 7822]